MIINKHEAASTKVALQDISQNFGDAVFIISNTRLEGRNVVYFATDAISTTQVQEGPGSLDNVPEIAAKKRLPEYSGRTARKKSAVPNTNRNELILQAEALQPTLPAVAAITALEQKLETLQGLLLEATGSMTQASTVVSSRLDGVELQQRKQKSGIDQMNRRLARQTELLSAILASLETRQPATIPKFQEYTSGTITRSGAKPGPSGCTNEKSPNHLLAYMGNNGSIYANNAFSTGVHAILTDTTTGSLKSIEEFSHLLGEAAQTSLPCLICFSPGKATGVPVSTFASVATERDLEKAIAKAGKNQPVVVFISTRDYLNQAKAFKCFTAVKIHCYFSHGTALEQLAFLEAVHSLRPQSLSVPDVPCPTNGLPELFCLLRCGIPLLFLGGEEGPLSTPDAIMPGYLGIKAVTNPGTLIGRIPGRFSIAAWITNSCTIVLRKLAGRILYKMESTNAE